jgi:hypothetical protein
MRSLPISHDLSVTVIDLPPECAVSHGLDGLALRPSEAAKGGHNVAPNICNGIIGCSGVQWVSMDNSRRRHGKLCTGTAVSLSAREGRRY